MSAGRRVVEMLVFSTVAGCSWVSTMRPAPVPEITDIGNGAYSLTRRSGALAERSDVLKSDAEQRALTFCAERHLALAMLDTRTDDPDPPAVSYATVNFRCVKP